MEALGANQLAPGALYERYHAQSTPSIYIVHQDIFKTRSLGALRALISSWRPFAKGFGPLDFVLQLLMLFVNRGTAMLSKAV